jgi:hypothetical protein
MTFYDKMKFSNVETVAVADPNVFGLQPPALVEIVFLFTLLSDYHHLLGMKSKLVFSDFGIASKVYQTNEK